MNIRQQLSLALSLLTGLALFASPGTATAQAWTIDAAHTSAGFSVRHMMIANVKGHFNGVVGTGEFDPARPEGMKITAEIDVRTVDTRMEKRDAHLRGADFFDVEKFPKMTFVSKQVKAIGKGQLQIVGDLTLRGVTREVVLEARGFDQVVKDPFGGTRVGGVATTKIQRKDFGLGWNKALESGGVLVGEEVTVTLEVELIQKA